jgi:hypothetical protein
MAIRKTEVVLVGAGAALLVWGLWRAGARGEPAAKAWTSYAMMALVIVTAINIFARKPAIAVACGVLCVLFLALVLLAALLGAEQAAPNRVAAVVRGVLFFVLIGVACLLQAMPSNTSPISDRPTAS